MATDRFEKVTSLETGDRIRIQFVGDDPVETGGIEFPNPWETTVVSVHEETKDPRQGDDVRHMEFHRTARVEPPDGVIAPDRVAFETAHRMDQDNKLSLVYRQLIEDSPGHYTLHPLGFEEIGVLD